MATWQHHRYSCFCSLNLWTLKKKTTITFAVKESIPASSIQFNTFFFLIRMLFILPRLSILIFLPILGWNILVLFLNYSLWHFRFRIYWGMCICITCTVHRTVISVEHFAIAIAGFFVLLASFAVQRKE